MIYIKLVFVLIVSIASAAGGWYFEHLEYKSLQAEYSAFQDKVSNEGKLQEVKNEQIKSEQQQITKTVSSNYESRIAQLHKYYGGLLVSQTRASASAMPNISTPSLKLDARPSYEVTIADCAQTTQQLVSLQDWIKQQSEVK
jgi:hypothetical protein